MNDILLKLEQWYSSQCDGEWEHQYGITIETVDNPGWSVKIDLPENDALRQSTKEIDIRRSETDIVQCSIANGKFMAFGGPCNLMEVLEIFLERKLE